MPKQLKNYKIKESYQNTTSQKLENQAMKVRYENKTRLLKTLQTLTDSIV